MNLAVGGVAGVPARVLLIVGLAAAVAGGVIVAVTVSKPPQPATITGNVEYFWDFGDGTQTSGFSPTHVFKKAGRYQIVLTAQNGTSTVTQAFELTVNEGQVFSPSVVEVARETLETNAQKCVGSGACNNNGVCDAESGENPNNCGDCCNIGLEFPLSTLCTCPPGTKRVAGNTTVACGTFKCVPLS
ncbi:PKD domain-containing protein [archaeon]|nr:PKD domain-containing protein [archaeon]